MLAMQDHWGAAFRAAGDIGRLRHQPGPVGIAMLSTGFAFIWLLLLSLNYTDGASVDSFAIMLPGFFMALLILGVDEVARWAAAVGGSEAARRQLGKLLASAPVPSFATLLCHYVFVFRVCSRTPSAAVAVGRAVANARWL